MLIEVKEVDFTYLGGSKAAKCALSDISLTVDNGEFLGLIGPTGSGKTTLVQILAGLVEPISGRILFENNDIWREPRLLTKRRSLVGLVFQEPEKQLFEMTVEEDIAFWPRNLGLDADEISARTKRALEAVGLDYELCAKRSPFDLSGGEMRRVAIAGILVMEPKVLILDEPTVGLDPKGKIDLMEKIKKLNDGGTAIIFVSHDMDAIAEHAHRVVVLDQGKVILDDAPLKIFGHGDLIKTIGLEVPAAIRIASRLRESGFQIHAAYLRVDQLERDILAAIAGPSV